MARMVHMYYRHLLVPRTNLKPAVSGSHKRPPWPGCTISLSPASHPRQTAAVLALLSLSLLFQACSRVPNTVAVIPRSCGTVLWEPEHAGVAHVARGKGLKVYWNAPPREDDVEGQIHLLEKVLARGYAGVIISPDQTLPLRTPVRRLVSRGLPVVVVGTNLGVLPGAKLSYVLNDDTVGGQIAARRLGKILDGKGSIAILGINPQLTGITVRERSFENTLEREYPGIQVVARRLGYYSVAQEQQVAEDILNRGKPVDAILALSHTSTRGAFYALVEFDKTHSIKLVGFDQDLMPPIRTGDIDSVVMQRSYDMGRVAMELMDAEVHGRTVPGITMLTPMLMTRENIDSAEVRGQLSANWWAIQ